MYPDWRLDLGSYVNSFVSWIIANFGATIDGVSNSLLLMLIRIEDLLHSVPWWAAVIIILILAAYTTRSWATAVVLAALPMLVGSFGLWELAVQTLAVVITSVILALSIGIPLGILMAESKPFEGVLRPLLDAMQTMPSFVYLIPVMMLFGLGEVPAVIATLVYSLPPIIRLTNLGLQQVSESVQEAALSYGATRWQLMREVRLPLAVPSILAGVNQTTMMALAMVVISSMIGARGLGYEVLVSINRVDVGRGFEAGISVVILAILIDRITQGVASRNQAAWK